MIGAIEILIIAVVFGIIYGRDAIDKTYKKHPDEGMMESLAEDVKEYYQTDPKRLVKMGVFVASIIGFFCIAAYWLLTRTDFLKMIGLE
ncbi:MAG: hypothetical protein NPINA01_22100 [Nitrospinaceae bacterium]|nr:MAG: hypothetical protein NPINA01_22100 [Nitrospinaceae bacterium]